MKHLVKVKKSNIGKRAKVFNKYDCTIVGTGKIPEDSFGDPKRYFVKLDEYVGKEGLHISTISAVPESLWVEEE